MKIKDILIGGKIVDVEIKNTGNGVSLNSLILDTKFGIIEMAWPSPQDDNIIAVFDSNDNKIE